MVSLIALTGARIPTGAMVLTIVEHNQTVEAYKLHFRNHFAVRRIRAVARDNAMFRSLKMELASNA